MLELNYTFTAIEPIRHFGDESTGNVSTLNRQKILLKKALRIDSKFSNDRERTNACIRLMLAVFNSIPHDRKTGFGGYDEFKDKLKAFAYSASKMHFINRLLESFEISIIKDEQFFDILDLFDNTEFLHTIRQQGEIIIAKIREIRRKESDERKRAEAMDRPADLFNVSQIYEPEQIDTEVKEVLTINTISVPYISGGSKRGILRDLVMYDYCKLAEIGHGINMLPKNVFHEWFSGGVLDDSTGQEDADFTKEYKYLNPMISLFGSAVGGQMIESCLDIRQPKLICLENGNGDISFYDQINIAFNTRRDDLNAGTDLLVDIPKSLDGKKEKSLQMIYHSEEFAIGSSFKTGFVLDSDNEIEISAFYQMLYLFTESPYLGGRNAQGCGKVEFAFPEPQYGKRYFWDKGEAYRIHVTEHAKEIWTFFNNPRKKKSK